MNISDLKIDKNIEIKETDALIIVDLQNDFIPGGSLPVEGGDLIINEINELAEIFNKIGQVILTQDWHPPDHLSFASNHRGKKPGDEYQSRGIGPVLWPDHCVQNSEGAKFHRNLKIELADKIIQKGINPEIDSYSGFLDNDKKSETGLADYLKSQKIERIFICGLALDYCCYATAMDGIAFGFDVYFLIDLTKGIDLPANNISNSLENMTKKGVKFVKKTSFS